MCHHYLALFKLLQFFFLFFLSFLVLFVLFFEIAVGVLELTL